MCKCAALVNALGWEAALTPTLTLILALTLALTLTDG